MKKVLALVLAVVMVCTMAMAVSVVKPFDPSTGSSGSPYAVITPGTVLAFDLTDLLDNTNGQAYPVNAANEIQTDKIKVTVSYGKGAELIAGAKWILKDGGDKKVAADYQYQITLKEDALRIANDKVLDLSITKMVVKAYGSTANEFVFDGDPKNSPKIEYAVGYGSDEYVLGSEGTTINLNDYGTVYTAVAGEKDGKAITTETLTVKLDSGNKYDVAAWTLKVGQKFKVADLATAKGYLGKTDFQTKYNYDPAKLVDGIANPINTTAAVTKTGVKDTYKVYAVGNDGKVVAVPFTVEDGVMTFTAPANSIVGIYNGSLKNVSAPAASGTTGTTTNPGTGANDVVGVAAALAVVALVSGAAISLKK